MNKQEDNVIIVFEAACDAHWMKDVVQFPNALANELFGKKAVLIARPNNCQHILKEHIELCTLGKHNKANDENFRKQLFSEIETSTEWYTQAIMLAAKKGSVLIIYPFCGSPFSASRRFKLLRWLKFKKARVVLKSDISEYFAAPGSLAFKAKYKATFKSMLRDVVNYFFIDRIICENGKIYKNLLRYQIHFRRKLVYVPNCPLDIYSKQNLPPYSKKSDTFLYVGRIDDVQKGIDILMDAWKNVFGKLPGWKLLISGAASHEKRAYWEEILKKTDVNNSIEWLGFLEPVELLEQYDNSKIVVCSSRWESGPIVLSEAILSGCAFIGTAAGEIPAILKGLPGLVQDEQSLAETMLHFARHPEIAGKQAEVLFERMKDRKWSEQVKKVFEKNKVKTYSNFG